jgi:DNA-binding NarL/FixJ family response regulator
MKRLGLVVVDDCEEFRRFMALFLKAKLPQVDLLGSVDSVEAALELIQSHAPDLVVMDLSVGPINGFQATAMLKKRANAPRVILISGNAGQEYRERAVQVGADAFICKSDLYGQLVPALDEIFSDEHTSQLDVVKGMPGTTP